MLNSQVVLAWLYPWTIHNSYRSSHYNSFLPNTTWWKSRGTHDWLWPDWPSWSLSPAQVAFFLRLMLLTIITAIIP